jgi:hypothetical protein
MYHLLELYCTVLGAYDKQPLLAPRSDHPAFTEWLFDPKHRK